MISPEQDVWRCPTAWAVHRRRCWFSSFSSSTWCGIGESVVLGEPKEWGRLGDKKVRILTADALAQVEGEKCASSWWPEIFCWSCSFSVWWCPNGVFYGDVWLIFRKKCAALVGSLRFFRCLKSKSKNTCIFMGIIDGWDFDVDWLIQSCVVQIQVSAKPKNESSSHVAPLRRCPVASPFFAGLRRLRCFL